MLQEWPRPPGDKSRGGLELCRDWDDCNRWRGMGLGGTSVGSLVGFLLDPGKEAGFMYRVE